MGLLINHGWHWCGRVYIVLAFSKEISMCCYLEGEKIEFRLIVGCGRAFIACSCWVVGSLGCDYLITGPQSSCFLPIRAVLGSHREMALVPKSTQHVWKYIVGICERGILGGASSSPSKWVDSETVV